MLFLDGKSLEAFEPNEHKALRKKIVFFDRLGLTAVIGGGFGTLGGIIVGLFNLIGPNFGVGDQTVAGFAFLASFGFFSVSVPTLLTAVGKWEKYEKELKSLESEQETETSDQLKLDSSSACDFDDPIRSYTVDLRF